MGGNNYNNGVNTLNTVIIHKTNRMKIKAGPLLVFVAVLCRS